MSSPYSLFPTYIQTHVAGSPLRVSKLLIHRPQSSKAPAKFWVVFCFFCLSSSISQFCSSHSLSYSNVLCSFLKPLHRLSPLPRMVFVSHFTAHLLILQISPRITFSQESHLWNSRTPSSQTNHDVYAYLLTWTRTWVTTYDPNTLPL